MAVESAEDLAGFFDPEEFGEPWAAAVGFMSVPFHGIYTEAPMAESPGTTARLAGCEPRIIANAAGLDELAQGDVITRKKTGARYSVNDCQRKGELLIIFLHVIW